MSHPFDDQFRRGSGRVVPVETARKIARQRDQLAEEVEKLREENDRLASARKSAETENDKLQKRLAKAERRLDELEAARADAESESRDGDAGGMQERDEAGASGDETARADSDLVARLKGRIGSLTSDLDRLRTRAETRESEARRSERIRLLAGLGDVLDSVERGLGMQSEGPWHDGLMAIHAQLLNFFRSEGATLTGSVGEPMDPRIHEAVDTVETPEFESGEIVDVERHGVVLEDDTVVRTAQVRVAE